MEESRVIISLVKVRERLCVAVTNNGEEPVTSNLIERVFKIQLNKHADPAITAIQVRSASVGTNLRTRLDSNSQLVRAKYEVRSAEKRCNTIFDASPLHVQPTVIKSNHNTQQPRHLLPTKHSIHQREHSRSKLRRRVAHCLEEPILQKWGQSGSSPPAVSG